MIKKIILLSGISFFIMSNTMLNALPQVTSAKEVRIQQEKKYTSSLAVMKKRSAVKEAQAAKSLGFPYLLAHYAGRSASMIIPGLNPQDTKKAQQRCPILIMDGLGDAIFGEQHMAYRKAKVEHATAFNKITYQACIAR